MRIRPLSLERQFHSIRKSQLIQAAIQAQPRQDEPWKQAAVSALNKISDPNGERNIVAHHVFSSDPSGGAVFRRVRIHNKSKSLMKDSVPWSLSDFEAKCASMDSIRAELERIRGGLMPVVYGELIQELAPITSSLSVEHVRDGKVVPPETA